MDWQLLRHTRGSRVHAGTAGGERLADAERDDQFGDLGCAYGMQFDHSGTLWVTTDSDVLDGFTASQLATSGSPVPTNVITGASTGLDDASGLALADTLPAPTAVRATTSGGAVVTVTWQAPPTPMYATSYVVTPIVNGVTQAPISTNSSAPTFSLSTTIGDTYSFKVAATDVFGTGPQGFGTGPQGTSNTVQTWGYWEVASDGGIFGFDAPFLGSQGGKPLNKPVVGMAAAPNGQGYWEVASDGGIFNYGDAGFFGSTGSIHLNKPIVGMAATPDGGGYWLVASDGGIFNYGDAGFFGSAGSPPSERADRRHGGHAGRARLLAGGRDGGIFNYGDAAFYGSAGGKPLNKPVVGIATSADGPATGRWPRTAASSTTATQDSSAPRAASPSTNRSSALRRRPTGRATGRWPRTAASSTTATPASTGPRAASPSTNPSSGWHSGRCF